MNDEIGEVGEKGESYSEKEREETYSEVEKEQESDIIKEAKDDDVREKLGEESDDSKWSKIDWSEETSSEREGSKWNEIDWNKGEKDEQENENKWNEIDWSKEKNDQSEDKNEEYDENDEKEGEYENIDSQSTVLIPEKPEIEGEDQEESEKFEHEEDQIENEEEIVEIDPEEYENDQDPIIDAEEIEFVRDMEELGRMLKEYDEKLGYSEEENDNTAFNAEQAYREIKERNSNKEEKEDAQELEEQENEITEEQKEEHIEEMLSGEVNDTSEEAEIEPEEFDYFWEKYEQYEQEGKSSEEITNLMQESEETYKLLKSVEKLYEQQEKEKLKLIDREHEEDDDDVREEIDRVDAIEYFLNTEEKLHQQGKSQEEIDEQVEEIAKDFFLNEIEEKQQNEQEKDVSEELRIEQAGTDEINSDLKEQEQIKQISVYDNDENRKTHEEVERKEVEEEIKTELDDIEVDEVQSYQEKNKESMEKEKKLESEEVKEDEYEKLQQLYRKETGKRPRYAGTETKGFIQWLEKQELKTKELEEKEQKKEKWQKKLKNWIEGSIEEELSSELKVVLKEILQNFQEYEKLEELYKRYEKGELTEKNKEVLNFIINKLLNISPIHLHLYLNISGFKAYYQEHHWWNPALINEIKYKFLRHLSKKYEVLKLYSKNISKFKQLHAKHIRKLVYNISPIKSVGLINYKKKLNQRENAFNMRHKKKNNEIATVPPPNITHFKQKAINYLKKLIRQIIGTIDQKEVIWLKSKEILDNLILRAENNEIPIPKNMNFKAIAGTIIYTVVITNKDMPKITMTQISNISNTFNAVINKLYKRYFKSLYPRKKFLFSAYPGFKRIRNIISLYFFELIKNIDIETSEIVLHLEESILKNIDLPEKLTLKEIEVLREFATIYQKEFVKYFTDLTDLLRQLIISSRILKKIGAFVIIKFITEVLEKKGVNLLQTSKTFYRSVIEVFDFLKENFPNFLPIRMIRIKTEEKLSRKEFIERAYNYRKIIGKRLKLYVIKHIYNGKYFKDGNGKCPGCLKEGFIINTDISRLADLEFHHNSNEKEINFSEDSLYRKFLENRCNPHFLEELIRLMESERIELLCRNHHVILHDEYYRYFKYLINWEDLFSLPAEQIYILIRISVDNFYKNKKSTKEKEQIRRSVVRKLKKRYIIENLFGENCPVCGEFTIKEHLPAFHFNHINEATKTVEASDLYNTCSCSEIVKKLEEERGGYTCGNCHFVLHYKYTHLLDEIYDDEKIRRTVIDDYSRVSDKFKLIQNLSSIGDPLKKNLMVRDGIERYLSAIYEISKVKNYVDTYDLRDYLQLSNIITITKFFRQKRNVINNYVNTEIGRPYHPTKYSLNEKGKKFVSLIYHFKEYYRSLRID